MWYATKLGKFGSNANRGVILSTEKVVPLLLAMHEPTYENALSGLAAQLKQLRGVSKS